MLARRKVTFWWVRRQTVEQVEAQLLRRYYHLVEVDEVVRVRVRGKREQRAVLVLDECHRWLNARAWDQAAGAERGAAIGKRLAIVGFISALRHYGFKAYLITQNDTNIDNQVRGMFEHHTELLNLKNLRVFGVSVFPFNLFLSKTFWRDKERTRIATSIYMLDRQVRSLYDTHALQLEDWPSDAIVLPLPPQSAATARQRRRTEAATAV